MGSMIRPVCAKCDAEFELLHLGSGFRNGKDEKCDAPVICDNCGTITTGNILYPDKYCKICGKENVYAGELSNKETRNSVFTWMVSPNFSEPKYYVLKWNAYRCPKCHTRNLSFATEGCWD